MQPPQNPSHATPPNDNRATIPSALIDRFATARNILFITGAGISADSGLPTYRGAGGLYDDKLTEEGLPIEDMLSAQMLHRRPDLTWKYLAKIEQNCRHAKPNAAHLAIAKLQAHQQPNEVNLLTQNIDGLHRLAGSQNLIEIHGNLHDLFCIDCDYSLQVTHYGDLDTLPPPCPKCNQWLRPNVVLFGESLPAGAIGRLENILYDERLDLVVSIGTTSVFPYIVEPVLFALRKGITTVEINIGTTPLSSLVDFQLAERAAPVLQTIVDALGITDSFLG